MRLTLGLWDTWLILSVSRGNDSKYIPAVQQWNQFVAKSMFAIVTMCASCLIVRHAYECAQRIRQNHVLIFNLERQTAVSAGHLYSFATSMLRECRNESTTWYFQWSICARLRLILLCLNHQFRYTSCFAPRKLIYTALRIYNIIDLQFLIAHILWSPLTPPPMVLYQPYNDWRSWQLHLHISHQGVSLDVLHLLI